MNYPRKIAIEKYPGIWVNYKQQYEFDGGMYYETDEDRDSYWKFCCSYKRK